MTAEEILTDIQNIIVNVSHNVYPNTIFMSPEYFRKIEKYCRYAEFSPLTSYGNMNSLYGMDVIINSGGIYSIGYCATVRNNWLREERT